MGITKRIGRSLPDQGERRAYHEEAEAFLDRVEYLTERGQLKIVNGGSVDG